MQILLSRTQAGSGRAVKEQQEQTSPNHVQRLNLISVQSILLNGSLHYDYWFIVVRFSSVQTQTQCVSKIRWLLYRLLVQILRGPTAKPISEKYCSSPLFQSNNDIWFFSESFNSRPVTLLIASLRLSSGVNDHCVFEVRSGQGLIFPQGSIYTAVIL